MKTVTVDREFDAPPQQVRSVFGDPAAYFRAIGFNVERDANRLKLTKRVALATVTLDVKIRPTAAPLAYEQVAGPFEAMTAEYSVGPSSAGTLLRIETTFDSPAVGVGAILDSATVRRQRRTELHAVEELLEATGESLAADYSRDTIGVGGD